MSSISTSPPGATDDVFIGDSEMARLMRAHDWAATPLGPVAGWAPSLKVALGLLLTSRFEMWLGWGEDIAFFYNDAYRPTLGAKHPQSLGQPVTGADQDADPYQLHRFLKDGSLATIQALAAAVDAKDPYTQGHSQRVADYATSLARHVGASQAELELIHITGTLHDVGKIGVPDAILKKPGRLDDEERIVMETHPVLGEVIVRKAPQLAATLPGVRHHHERWDGKGYPDGLAGEAIPLMARYLALADTFDAMTSDRPYRKGLPLEVALAEIHKGAGTQFDPALAPAFIELMQQMQPLARAA